MGAPALNLPAWESTSDEDVVKRVLAGETALYEILIRRYNQRLYRVARSILRDEADAEDVMQEAYVRAYQHLNQFAGEAKFSTWLTKIAVYEALGRVKVRGRTTDLESVLNSDTRAMPTFTPNTRDPERQAYDQELRLVLERSVEALPEIYRMVFVLRSVEGLSVSETARCLDIGPEASQDQALSGEVLVAERPSTARRCRDCPGFSVSPVPMRPRGRSRTSTNRA